MIRSPKLAARRVAQTFKFRNGPQVLWDLASARTPWPRAELRFVLPGGGTIVCPNVPGARVPVYELFVEDAYRLDELTAGLRADFVALDLGGQVGCFSTALARHSRQARVFTYEASPSTAVWLRRNVAANGLDDRVTTFATAVSDHHGVLEFADNGHGSGLNGLTAPEGSQVVEVPCVTFDEAVASAGEAVDLVKIDTEGAEYSIVLPSAKDSWTSVQKVVLEYHPVAGHSHTELIDFFDALGLRVVRSEPADHELGSLWLSR
jgi:FkbM family methyltransferase